jgi:serine/threonine-protein kinase
VSDVATRLSHALADRYRVERELGVGGMATVLLAHDLKHDRKVAVKVLKPGARSASAIVAARASIARDHR